MRYFFLTVFFLISLAAYAAGYKAADNNLDKANPVSNYYIKTSMQNSAERFSNSLVEIFPGSTAYKFAWLETENPRRSEFLAKTKIEAQEKVMKGEFEKIYNFLLPSNSGAEVERFVVQISASRKITMSSKDFEVKVQDIDGDSTTVIYSTAITPAKNANPVQLSLSADKKIMGIVISYDGSIDISTMLFYDIEQRKILSTINQRGFTIPWWSNEVVLITHEDSSSKGMTMVDFNVRTSEVRNYINSGSVNIGDWLGFTDYSTDNLLLKNHKTGQILNYSHLKSNSIIAETDSNFFILEHEIKKMADAIYLLPKFSQAQPELFLKAEEGRYLDQFVIGGDYFFVKYIVDATSILKVYNRKAEYIDGIIIPPELSLDGFSWKTEGEVAQLILHSSLNVKTVEWTLKKPFDFKLIVEELLKKDDLEIETKIIYVPSFDGVQIPMRLTYRKGLAIDQHKPVYMQTYGGFVQQGYLAPTMSKMILEFIKRGGIAVGTGVRGGSERGYSWYEAAAGKNKHVTSLDLIACAKYLVQKGYAQADQIVSTGTSNGGYVVASAAMMSPESFGLVIPINGVQDQLSSSDLDTFGISWQIDYLDPFQHANHGLIIQRAPLELATKLNGSKIQFLVVNGEQDGRVNKVHSYKLKAHLDELAIPSILLSFENTGHHPTSANSGDIGLRANATIWSHIFKYSGLKF